MSLKDADKEQNKLLYELNCRDKGRKPIHKMPFLNSVGLFLSARNKILNNLKSKKKSLKNWNKISASETTPEWTPDPTIIETPKTTKAKKYKHKIFLLKITFSLHLSEWNGKRWKKYKKWNIKKIFWV